MARHMQNFYKDDNDPLRCDNVQVATAARTTHVPIITEPVLVDPVCAMARKPRVKWHEERAIRSYYCILDVTELGVDTTGARNIVSLQDRWDEYLLAANRGLLQRKILASFFIFTHVVSCGH